MEQFFFKQRWRVFLVVSAGVFMSTMDSSMINVALPVVMQTFHSSLAQTEWVVLMYLMTITVMLLFWGRLSDRWQCGAIYSSGMLIFAIGSLCCSVAMGIYNLIFFRFVQAMGASMMMAMGPALIKSAFPAEKLGSRLGLIGVATSLGLMTGPAVSGLLIRWYHWRAIFFVTVPVGLLFFFLGRKPLRELSAHIEKKTNTQKRSSEFDTLGAVLWAFSIITTLFLATHLTSLQDHSKFIHSPLFAVYLALMAASWLFLLVHEKRFSTPLLPVALFRKRFFLMAVLSANLSFAVLFSVLILIPFFLDRVLGLKADMIGYVMMSVPLGVFIVSPLAGRIHDRMGAKIVATTGLACCLISLLFLTTLTPQASPITVAARLFFLGIGQAMFLSPNSAAVLSGVSHKHAGITASILATARNMGMLLGTAFTGLVFTLFFSGLTGGLDLRDFSPDQTGAFMLAMKRTFQYWALFGFSGVLASWLRGEGKQRQGLSS